MLQARALELRAARVHAEHEALMIAAELDAVAALPPSCETQVAIALLQQRARDLELHVGQFGSFMIEVIREAALQRTAQ